MKNRTLLALLLIAGLAVTAVAQQQTPSSRPAPAAQSAPPQTDQTPPSSAPSDPNTSQAAKDQASQQPSNLASGKQPLAYEDHQGFWGKINPFARKKYVQRQLTPVRDRVNELDELTAANSKMIRDVDARASEGIRLAASKASEADQHAIDAGNRAQMAHQTAQQANERLAGVEQVVGTLDQYKAATQVELIFRPGQLALSQKAKGALDELAASLKAKRGYIVEVQGFSSGRGAEAIQNSQKMADAVVRYLVLNHEVPVYRIYTLGMGNAPVPASSDTGKTRRTRGGRVEVSLMTNALADMSQSAQNTAPATMGSTSGSSTEPAASGSSSMPQSDNPPAAPAVTTQPSAPQAPATTQPGQQQTPPPTPPKM
ncbi:MAG TPA: OmpA family protein [Terriglobales bacterium]|nr:OmpA family protein [Terriglobales bacterium]